MPIKLKNRAYDKYLNSNSRKNLFTTQGVTGGFGLWVVNKPDDLRKFYTINNYANPGSLSTLSLFGVELSKINENNNNNGLNQNLWIIKPVIVRNEEKAITIKSRSSDLYLTLNDDGLVLEGSDAPTKDATKIWIYE